MNSRSYIVKYKVPELEQDFSLIIKADNPEQVRMETKNHAEKLGLNIEILSVEVKQ